MNVADCSMGSNPLLQLNKHNQQESSIQGSSRRHLAPNLTSSSSSAFKSGPKSVSRENKQYIDAFMNGQTQSLKEVQRDESNFQNKNMSLRSNKWSEEFRGHQNVASGNVNMSRANVNAPLSQNNSAWSTEFQSKGLQNPSRDELYRDTTQGASYESNFSRMNYVPQMSYMNQMPQQAPVFQNSTIHSEKDWQKEFWDLEQEVNKNLKLDEESASASKQDNGDQESKEGETDSKFDDYQNVFQEVWDSINKDAQDILPEDLYADKDAWSREHQRYFGDELSSNKEYEFSKTNTYLKNPNAYEIGCILMENGAKLSEAALAFEAAIQEDPKHTDAWLKLGIVQIQNEKELIGITALENCLKLNETNLEAMKNLAISYINEGYDVSALTMLNRWIETKYPDLLTDNNGVQLDANQDRHEITSFVMKQFQLVAEKAKSQSPDVQLGLGLLYYLNSDFEMTIKCFKTALSVAPDDVLMWNRLGASLANNNKPEEAIQAYHKALQLKPSFVRARYNLAVSSLNIGCYKEAAEHLLTALSMHEVEGAKTTSPLFTSVHDGHHTDNVLDTLKRAFISMERTDLVEKVKPGMNLDVFRTDFNF